MNKIIGSLLALMLTLSANPCLAGFQNVPASIKAEAMGGAFVAMADDPTTVFLNPAGLTNLDAPEASLMYGKPLYGLEGVDLSEGYSALGFPIGRRFAAGLGGTMYRAAGILSEYQWSGGFSGLITPKLSLGASVSYLYHNYEIASDPAYGNQGAFQNGASKGAVGFNVGMLVFPTARSQVGISVRNLNKPDVGLMEKDPVPSELLVGGLYRFSRANVQVELGERDNGLEGAYSLTTTWKLGLEVPIKGVSLRAGVNNDAMTAGLGLRWGSLGFDYAFSLFRNPESTNDTGTQLLAISYKIGAGKAAQSKAAARPSHQDDAWSGRSGEAMVR